MITAETIHNATLKRSLFGGYSIADVDDLLDQVEAQLTSDQQDYAAAGEKISGLKRTNQEKETQIQAYQQENDRLKAEAGLTADRIRAAEEAQQEAEEKLAAAFADLAAANDRIRELEEQLAAAAAEPASAPAQEETPAVPGSSDISSAILTIHQIGEGILKDANTRAEAIRAEAQKKADDMLSEAKTRSDSMVSDALANCSHINAEYNKVRKDMSQFCANVLTMFREKVASLSDMPEYCALPESAEEIAVSQQPPAEASVGIPESTGSKRFSFLKK